MRSGRWWGANRLWLGLLWLLFYGSFALFEPPLLDDADSVHAEVAREMLLRHDWVTLYANGIRYLEKAPLFYWSMAAAMKLLGATTAASRLPLALSVLALALVMEAFARRAFGSARAGLYAGLMTLSSFGIFIFSRINIPDVLVCLLLTVAMLCYVESEREERPSRRVCFGFALACALDVLTKGLIGVVFPLGIVGLHLLWRRGWRGGWARVLALRPLASAAVFLVIAVPWHVLAAVANPGHGHPGDLSRASGHWAVPLPSDGNVHGWAWFYFINEQVYRYLNVRVPHDYDTAPLWLFWGLLAVWLMPWSAFVPWAVRAGWRARGQVETLLLLWAALPLVFFSLSTRQEYYVLPSLPPLLLLVARWLGDANRSNNRAEPAGAVVSSTCSVGDGEVVRVARSGAEAMRVAWLLAVAGGVAALACAVFLLYTRTPAAGTDLASLLQQNPGDYALSFGHFLDLNGRALGLFRVPLLLAAVALGGGAVAHLLLRRGGRLHGATLALAAGAFGFLLAAWLGLRTFAPTLTSAQLARAIAQELRPGDMVAIHGEYEAGSTLGFYLRRNDLHIVEGRSSNLWYGSFFPDAPKIFETRDSIAARWTGSQRIFLWEDPADTERPVLELPGPAYVVANSGGKRILSNRAPGSAVRHRD